MFLEPDLAPSPALPGSLESHARPSRHPGQLVHLVYRSRAALPLSGAPLAELLRAARRRNHREGVTGLLIADGSHYLQWLEGPSAGVANLMRSISLDRRHDRVEILSDRAIASRRFAGWDMRLASDRSPADGCPALHLPGSVIDSLWDEPEGTPDLMATLGIAPGTGIAARAASLDRRRPGPGAGREQLAAFLLAIESGGLPVEGIALPGRLADLRSHAAALIEPAARRMGDLWMEDARSEIEVTIALGRLQQLARHLGRRRGGMPHHPGGPAVLVAPLPGEPHGLGAVLASECLWLSGYPHAHEIPASDAALRHLLHARPFDMLDLSLSPAFQRQDKAGRLRRRLAGFRAASCNPDLRIRLSGRLFVGHHGLAGLVGADATSGSSADLDIAVRRMVDLAAWD
jgi:hypothetical protein